MPLNSHSYLVAQGWQGTGRALREGAISRPVIISQKKCLAGVGGDRDEAFPFWDHVFAAAATSIEVKLYNDHGGEDTDPPQPSSLSTLLDRTSTGIVSNKPKKVGLSVLETPAVLKSTRLSIMGLAKRETARRCLYSRFFRGPVLGPDAGAGEPPVPGAGERPCLPQAKSNEMERNTPVKENKRRKRKWEEEDKKTGAPQKKRKSKKGDDAEDERAERRRLKRLKREARKREGVGESGTRR